MSYCHYDIVMVNLSFCPYSFFGSVHDPSLVLSTFLSSVYVFSLSLYVFLLYVFLHAPSLVLSMFLSVFLFRFCLRFFVSVCVLSMFLLWFFSFSTFLYMFLLQFCLCSFFGSVQVSVCGPSSVLYMFLP